MGTNIIRLIQDFRFFSYIYIYIYADIQLCMVILLNRKRKRVYHRINSFIVSGPSRFQQVSLTLSFGNSSRWFIIKYIIDFCGFFSEIRNFCNVINIWCDLQTPFSPLSHVWIDWKFNGRWRMRRFFLYNN